MKLKISVKNTNPELPWVLHLENGDEIACKHIDVLVPSHTIFENNRYYLICDGGYDLFPEGRVLIW